MTRARFVSRRRPAEADQHRRPEREASESYRAHDGARHKRRAFSPVMLQFADESAAVSAEMRARIAASALALLQALEEEPELQISVAALPEDMREDPFPHPMSLARAQSVKEELVRNGVPASLIEVLRANSATHETARHEQPHVLIAAEPRVLLPRKGQGR